MPPGLVWARSHPGCKGSGHVFDPGTDREVADLLATPPPQCLVVTAPTNSLARPGVHLTLQDAEWTHLGVVPFGDLQ